MHPWTIATYNPPIPTLAQSTFRSEEERDESNSGRPHAQLASGNTDGGRICQISALCRQLRWMALLRGRI